MPRPPTLLELLHRLIERTYAMQTGIAEVHHFVLGDLGFERLRRDQSVVELVSAEAWPDAALLVREDGGRLRVSLYYPDALIAALERRNPLLGLDARNLDAFAVFVEELDHLLTLADRAGEGRASSLFELELHAGVTKHLACRHFLERTLGRELDAGELGWLRWSLFEKLEPVSVLPEVRERYLDADRLAGRYVRGLERLEPRARLEEVRRFHRLPAAAAVRRIESLSDSR